MSWPAVRKTGYPGRTQMHSQHPPWFLALTGVRIAAKNFTQYALAGDLSNGFGRDPVKNLVRLVLAKYFLR